MLRQGNKSDILKCIEAPTTSCADAQKSTVHVLDMAALIHMVRPVRAATFNDYIHLHLVPHLKSQITPSVQRIDAVWDTYPEHSLKSHAHLRWGFGPRTRIDPTGSTPIPKRDWQTFLANTDNKRDLFSYCSQMLSDNNIGSVLILTTKNDSVLSNRTCDMLELQPCNHFEADSRIFLHLAHASRQEHEQAYVLTVDSDAVVLAISFFRQLGFSKLWVGFGTGKNYRDIPIHDLYSNLGPFKSDALLLFHAISGCDTTSQLLGCGKKTAWGIWKSML